MPRCFRAVAADLFWYSSQRMAIARALPMARSDFFASFEPPDLKGRFMVGAAMEVANDCYRKNLPARLPQGLGELFQATSAFLRGHSDRNRGEALHGLPQQRPRQLRR